MKQTAVEWLRELYENQPAYDEFILDEQWEQAKKMEKEQIMDAHYAPKYGCFSEGYYNETYGGKDA
jgi:hypothetical protein